MYILMAVVFFIGYLCIAFEHPLKIDKAALAILTAVLCWTLLVMGADSIIVWTKIKWWGFTALCVLWVITFSHFLPRKELPLPGLHDIAKGAGCTRIEEQLSEW